MTRNEPQSRHIIISDFYRHIIVFHLYNCMRDLQNYILNTTNTDELLYGNVFHSPIFSKHNIPFEAKLHNFLLLFEKNVIIIFILRDNQIISKTSNSLFSCSVSFHNTQNIWLEGMLCKSTRGIHCCFCSL